MHYRTEKIRIFQDGRRMKLLVLRSSEPAPTSGRTGVLWIHGGGYVTGMPEMAHWSRAAGLVRHCGAVVLTPDYRLAGQAPYPAALRDCHAALLYLRAHAEALGIRSDQIMVGGESAGGGLAAALCMYERDTGGVRIACQIPLYPMLDCEDTETSRDNHAPVWNTRRNHYGWARYLRGLDRTAIPPYASPARCANLRGLPPMFTFVSTAEPFYAETLTFVRRLREAGVEAAADVYPGLFHAFDMLCPFLPESRRATARFEQRFMDAQRRYFAAQQP